MVRHGNFYGKVYFFAIWIATPHKFKDDCRFIVRLAMTGEWWILRLTRRMTGGRLTMTENDEREE